MSAALDIAIVCFASLGGSGIIAAEVAGGLARRGHRVHLVADGIPGRPVAPHPNLHLHAVRVVPYPLFDHAPYDLAVASALVDLCATEPIDVINAHYAVPHAASAYLARQAIAAGSDRPPRIVASLHGTDVTRLGSDPSYASITRFAVAAADALTVPSRYLEAEARRCLDLPADAAIEVIANFVDTDHFAPPDIDESGTPGDGLLLVHVSNLREVKRVIDLPEVLVRVRRQLPARLLVVGDGPERERAAQRAVDLGVGDSIRFLGKQADVAGVLQTADAFVLPSASESFGVAALEALSCGVPVFGYAVGGLPELVTPDVGRLVTPADVDALAAAIVAEAGDPERRRRMRVAARARALESFRREPALARYERLFRRVAGMQPAAAASEVG